MSFDKFKLHVPYVGQKLMTVFPFNFCRSTSLRSQRIDYLKKEKRKSLSFMHSTSA